MIPGGKDTSGLYFSYMRKSEYHSACAPTNGNRKAASAPIHASGGGGKPTHSEAAYAKCDVVTQDEIWKQAVDTEKKGVKKWEANWGFISEFDSKGRPKSAKEIPEEVNMYSPNIPNTNAGSYGGRLNTELGQMMQNLEFNFNAGNRKKKLGNDLVCY